jgi:hypothetical protein
LAAGSFLLFRRARPDVRFSTRVPVRVLVAALIAGSIVLVPGVSSLARSLIASGVYLAALLALKAIPVELLDAALHRPQAAGR